MPGSDGRPRARLAQAVRFRTWRVLAPLSAVSPRSACWARLFPLCFNGRRGLQTLQTAQEALRFGVEHSIALVFGLGRLPWRAWALDKVGGGGGGSADGSDSPNELQRTRCRQSQMA